jgi:glutamate formiminotransferase
VIQEGVPRTDPTAIIECVPNVSEGRRADVIRTLAASVARPGNRLLDCSSDPSHNRTVLTMAGNPAAVMQAILQLFAAALATIDLRIHTGVHPRIGAVDVVPFVPLEGATMKSCVEAARSTAARVASTYGVPVYLYEEAALNPQRRNLSEIRRGGFERLAEKMRDPQWHPDFGPSQPHPSAGVAVIGARPILIAYNVNLASERLDVAQHIARSIRESDGGFHGVKAIGVRLEHRRIVQVSINVTDYKSAPLQMVFDAVQRLAAAEDVNVLESEIVGLVPADALPPDAARRLKLSPAAVHRVIEERLSS